jgi:tryptophan synthase alpha chain
MIEVGIPFSDPLADGPVIQASSMKALQNGFRVDGLFEDLEQVKDEVTIPLVPMGYFNTVLSYGMERFLKRCQGLGIDSVILPDMPIDIYEAQFKALFEAHGLSPVFLITPKTEEARIRRIDALSKSFIYVVADNSITGSTGEVSQAQKDYFDRIKGMHLESPLIIGFGISDKASFDRACETANGAIIGSAFIKHVAEEGDLKSKIHEFVKGIRG